MIGDPASSHPITGAAAIFTGQSVAQLLRIGRIFIPACSSADPVTVCAIHAIDKCFPVASMVLTSPASV